VFAAFDEEKTIKLVNNISKKLDRFARIKKIFRKIREIKMRSKRQKKGVAL